MKMKGPSIRSIIFFLLLAVLGACAVREAPEQSGRRQGKLPAAGAKGAGTAFAEEGLAGIAHSSTKIESRGMTAAHKTLPLGVMVRVKNQENGKSAVVRITKRGPLVKGRVLDLAPGAAHALGMKEEGAAAVKLEALGFRRKRSEVKAGYRQPASYDAGNFSVQVMAFADAEQARVLAAKLKGVFGYAEVRATTEGGQHFYRVLAGKYSSLREAQEAEKNFCEYGYPASFVLALE